MPLNSRMKISLALITRLHSRPLAPRVRSTRYADQVFAAPLGDVYPSSLVKCCCMELQAETAVTDRWHHLSMINSERRDPRLGGHTTRTTLLRHPCRHSQADRRSRQGQRSFDTDRWFWLTSAVYIILSPSSSGYPITAKVRSLSTWPGRQVEIPSDRDEGRFISFLGRVVAQ